jgi:electron transfer flavoprotein alpha/beta subunit
MPGTMALFLLSALFSAPAFAGVYSWTDDQGVVHFTDTQPRNQSHETVTLKQPSVVSMSENLEQGRRVNTIRKDIRQSLKASSSRTRSRSSTGLASASNDKQCAGYRKRLARIQRQLRAGYSNDQGNRLRRQRRSVSQALSRECLLQ